MMPSQHVKSYQPPLLTFFYLVTEKIETNFQASIFYATFEAPYIIW